MQFSVFFSFLSLQESEHTITVPPIIVKENLGKNKEENITKVPKFGTFILRNTMTKQHICINMFGTIYFSVQPHPTPNYHIWITERW